MNFIEIKIAEILKNLFWYEENFFIYENDLKKNQWYFSLKETMKIFWILKKWELKSSFQFKNPEEICEKIISEINVNTPENKKFLENIEKFEIQKPGFINIFLTEKWILKFFENQEEIFLENKKNNQNKKILVEYWNENIAKEMWVGHLRSNIIWKSLINLLKKMDFQVSSINHLWDYWTQFWKLIYAWNQWWNKEELEKNPIKFLNKIYVKFNDEYEKAKAVSEEKWKEFNEFWKIEFKKLEDWDEENLEIWKIFVKYSLKEFQEKYHILWSKFDLMQWEYFYWFMLDEIIWWLNKSEIWEIWENWAKIVKFFDKKWEEKAPLMYQKGDWSSTYATRDLAAIKWRAENVFNKTGPNEILYCVWKEQSQHFEQVFEVAEKMNWNKWAILTHIKNGHYRLPEWKMSTRKWNVIKLDKLIETSRIKARELLETKESFWNFDSGYKEKLVESIAIWAIKFNDLCQDRDWDITFTFEKAITFDWMSGPYMQYAHTRAASILRKIWDFKTWKLENLSEENFSKNIDQKIKEKNLLFFISKHYWVLELSLKTYKVHHIARYIYNLSQEFNSFYAVCNVVNPENDENWENKKLRIFLTKKVKEIIWEGLKILGVDDLEIM